jgi:peptidoglycan/LPS O-acetylase OafA/YrhL
MLSSTQLTDGANTAQTTEFGSRKNYEIETLRAVAIVIVAFQHSFNYLVNWHPSWATLLGSYLNLGQAGVDLFLVISGYVIAKSLLPKLCSTDSMLAAWKTMVAFWIKRIYRLWPTAFFWISVDVFLAAWFNRSDAFGPLRETIVDAVSAVAQVANFHHAYCAQGACFSGPVYTLGPLWSLSLEEQFYLGFPILVFLLLFYRRMSWLLPILALVTLAQLFLTRPDGSLLLYIRTDALCAGIMIYLLSSLDGMRIFREPLLNASSVTKVLTVGLLFLVLIAITGRAVSFNAGISAAIAFIFVAIAHFEANWFRLPRGSVIEAVVLWIGARSYSIYVIHCIAIGFVVELWWRIGGGVAPTGASTLKFYLVWFIVLALAAEANWRFIEVPLRIRGRKIAVYWSGPDVGVRSAASVATEEATAIPARPVDVTPLGV